MTEKIHPNDTWSNGLLGGNTQFNPVHIAIYSGSAGSAWQADVQVML